MLYVEALAIIGREYADNLRLPDVARRIGASEACHCTSVRRTLAS